MKTTTVTEAKAHLDRLLALVQEGETVLILSRGRPVARLEPVREPVASPSDPRVARLVRHGVLRRPSLPVDLERLAHRGAPVPADRGLLAALLGDRGEGR